MTEKRKRWLLAIGYVVFIYATLAYVRAPVNFLRSHGVLRFSLSILYALCFLFLYSLLLRRKPPDLQRSLGLSLIAFAYYLIAQWVKTPEEQIHFFQYGLVGVFFLRALETHSLSKRKTLFAALFLSAIAGWIDEIFQGWLPNRHYDIRDVYLNIISAFLGLITSQIVVYPKDLVQPKKL